MSAVPAPYVKNPEKILPERPRRLCNEVGRLAAMVYRSPIQGKTIVIADRGYESYNNFAHMELKGWNYVIRVKDLDSSGILSSLRLPTSGEFDMDVHLTLTKNKPKRPRLIPRFPGSSLPRLPMIFGFAGELVLPDFLSGCSFRPAEWRL